MIELKELTLGYGQRTLLETVNARITGGQLVALLGRNGTGKSTLLRAMMGLEKPQSGEITLQGKNIASLKPEKLARNISFVTTDKVRIANLRCKDVLCLLLKKLAQEEKKCVLFSTHDLDIALSLCDSIMLIDNPQMYTLPTPEMVASGHIERLFRNESVTFDVQEMRVRIK